MPETQLLKVRATVGWSLLSIFLVIPILPSNAFAQATSNKTQPPVAPQVLSRTTTRHEVRRLGYGSAVTILGAPSGTITIEGWNKSEVDVTAEIELHANTEEDLARLALVNSFALVKDGNRVSIISTGTHDKKFMKKAAKDFPKSLLGLPWKIDYHIRVPVMSDLDIDAGRGAINLSGVEGAISLKAVESDARLNVAGGILSITMAVGKVNLIIPARSWRGRGVEIRLALGDVTVQLPPGFSGDINANILRTGKIENGYTGLTPIEETVATPTSLQGRSGAGGAVLIFTVGDGTISIKNLVK